MFDGNRLNDHPADNPRTTMGETWLGGERGVMRLDGNARLWWKDRHSNAMSGSIFDPEVAPFPAHGARPTDTARRATDTRSRDRPQVSRRFQAVAM